MRTLTNKIGSNSPYQINALDGLRGLAVIIVIISHTSNSGLFLFPGFNGTKIGKVGVFLFFILSSYLLTRPFIDAVHRKLSSKYMLNYAMRRILRIFPLYVLYLLLAVLTTLYFDLNIAEKARRIPFRLNWTGFWQHLFLQEGKGVTWSIPVEFKYYFILPFVAFLYAKIIPYHYVGATFLTLVLWGLLYSYREVFSVGFELLHTVSYAEIFIMGAYAAAIKVIWDKTPPSMSLRRIISCFAIIAVICLLITIPSVYVSLIQPVKLNFMHENIVFFSFAWFFILLAILSGGILINRILSMNWLRFIGKISFSLYLIHMLVLLVIRLLNLNYIIAAWLVLGISVILSTITYYVIERPFSKIKLSH